MNIHKLRNLTQLTVRQLSPVHLTPFYDILVKVSRVFFLQI